MIDTYIPQVVQLTFAELEELFRSSGWLDPAAAKDLRQQYEQIICTAQGVARHLRNTYDKPATNQALTVEMRNLYIAVDAYEQTQAPMP